MDQTARLVAHLHGFLNVHANHLLRASIHYLLGLRRVVLRLAYLLPILVQAQFVYMHVPCKASIIFSCTRYVQNVQAQHCMGQNTKAPQGASGTTARVSQRSA